MANEDTVNLLKECNSGVQMAVFSIQEVLEDVKNNEFRQLLSDSITKHNELGNQTHSLMTECGMETSDPGPIAKGMSWMKTNAKIMMDSSDKTCADLITEGCNMGIKSLYSYLNEYSTADEKAKKLAEEIIREEEALRHNLRSYL